MKVKDKFRKLFIDFLIRFGDKSRSSLAKDLQLLKDFDDLWNDEYSTDIDKFLDFCNKLLYYRVEENKTDDFKFRIYSVIRWLIEGGYLESIPIKSSRSERINLDKFTQSIDNICHKLNHKEKVSTEDINKFFESFSIKVDIDEVGRNKFRLKYLITKYVGMGFIEPSDGIRLREEIDSIGLEWFDEFWRKNMSDFDFDRISEDPQVAKEILSILD